MKMILYSLFFIIPSVFTAKLIKVNDVYKVDIFDQNGLKYSEKNVTQTLLWIRFHSINNQKKTFWLKIKRKKMIDFTILVKSNNKKTHNLSTMPQSTDCHFFAASHLMTHQNTNGNGQGRSSLLNTDKQTQDGSSPSNFNTHKLDDLSFVKNEYFQLVNQTEDEDDVSQYLPISLCHGLSGIITLPDGQHLVKIESSNHINLNMVHLTKIPKLPANNIEDLEGYGQLKHGADAEVRRRHKRIKRSFKMPVHNMPGPFLVELYLIVDSKMADRYYGNDYSRLLSRIKSIMNQINVAFMQFNIYFTVVQLEIWEYDQIKLTDENHILMELQLYKRQFIDKRHDCLHAILGENLGSARRGQSEPASMCAFNRCVGYTKDYGGLSELEIAHSVMHEIGHNFGLSHDTEKCHCFGCIMATGVEFGSSKFQWSNCSKREISGLLNSGMSDCLLDRPLSNLGDFYPVKMSRNKVSTQLNLVSLSKCGNGVVDEGEDCDCGGSKLCSSEAKRCCVPETCSFTSRSYCASGACCDLRSCTLKSVGTICRSMNHKDCDLPEYCNGDSEWCPADSYKHNGVPCKTDAQDWSHCYHGECHSRKSWCRVLYGNTAEVADSRCYAMNRIGNDIKNCGLDIPVKDDRYRQPKNWNTRPCSEENVKCGRLWCKHENERVLRSSPQIEIDEVVQGYHCSAARFYLDWFLDDAGLVPNGSPCGYGKLCWRGVCIHSVYNDMGGCYCHGHGVCNNRGHCHCDPGFAPPNCTTLGDGGSIDSGLQRGFHSKTKVIIAGIFIFLVVVITILVLVTLIYHYNTRRWPSLLAKIKLPHYKMLPHLFKKQGAGSKGFGKCSRRKNNSNATLLSELPCELNKVEETSDIILKECLKRINSNSDQLSLEKLNSVLDNVFIKKSESEMETKVPNKFENNYSKILRPPPGQLKITADTFISKDNHQSPLCSPTSPSPIFPKEELIYANIPHKTSPPLLKNHKKPSSVKSKATMFDKITDKRTTNLHNPQLKVHKPIREENKILEVTSVISKREQDSTTDKHTPQLQSTLHQKPPLLCSKPTKPLLKSAKPEVAKKPNHSILKPPLLTEKPPKTIIPAKPEGISSRPALKSGDTKISFASATAAPTPSKEKPLSSSKRLVPSTKTTKAEISQPRLDQTTCTAKTCDLPSTDQALSRTVGPHKILKVEPNKAVKYLY